MAAGSQESGVAPTSTTSASAGRASASSSGPGVTVKAANSPIATMSAMSDAVPTMVRRDQPRCPRSGSSEPGGSSGVGDGGLGAPDGPTRIGG